MTAIITSLQAGVFKNCSRRDCAQMRSTSEARNQAFVELLILTLYHIGDTGSSGVAIESMISTRVPS